MDGSVSSRKANLDIAVLRGEFPEEPLDTWVAQRGEVSQSSVSGVGFDFLSGGTAVHPTRGPPCPRGVLAQGWSHTQLDG